VFFHCPVLSVIFWAVGKEEIGGVFHDGYGGLPDGYEEVMRRLTGGLQFMPTWHKEWLVPLPGTISPARDQLGEAPQKMLFERLAVPLTVPGHPVRGSESAG
jgi:hypothetical protein